MRLLNTTSKILEEFQGTSTPPYAILSHVWGEEEVLFKDMNDPQKAEQMKGYSKIAASCAQAVQDRLQYIWIDTCCINKESSAELSEAINSMYAWYRDARVCYAYLADVRSNRNPELLDSTFSTSKWFTRGWTLQELLAPLRVDFFAGDWVNIGTKSTLQDQISIITGISVEALLPRSLVDTYDDVPIAVRMFWASGRKTTRVEDIAYCLLGIFDVNMPLLYGEGKKAFIRLQHEIIRKSNDQSIFAWRSETWLTVIDNSPSKLSAVQYHADHAQGILARSPVEFQHSNKVERSSAQFVAQIQSPYSITNRGLHIELPLVPCNHPQLRSKDIKVFRAQLNCHIAGIPVDIILVGDPQGDPLARFGSSIFGMELGTGPESLSVDVTIDAQYTPIFIRENIPDRPNPQVCITATVSKSAGYQVQYVTSKEGRHESEWQHITVSGAQAAWRINSYNKTLCMGAIVLKGVQNADVCAIACGFRGRALWVDVTTDFEKESVNEIHRSDDFSSLLATISKPGHHSQCLDRSSAVLSSGWAVIVSSSMTHQQPGASGNPPLWCYEIDIKFERAKLAPRERMWEQMRGRHGWGLESENPGAYQVNLPVRQSEFRVLTEDLHDSTYCGKWLKQKNTFICHLTIGQRSYVLPFYRIRDDLRTEFYMVIDQPPPVWDRRGPRIAIVKSRPNRPEDVLMREGRVRNSHSVPSTTRMKLSWP